MKLQDKSTHTQFTTDDRGYLTTTAKLARIGAMQYLGEEIGKTPNKVYDVYVEAEDLFSPETIKSFENTPVTIEHPEEMFVDSSNWHELAVGHITNIRPDASNEYLLGDVVINSPKAIEVIRDGKIEVSCGYDAELIDANGKIKKANIKGNHLAIVDEGRCGDKCKLGDGKPTMKKTLKDSLRGLFKPKAKKATLADSKQRLADAQGEYTQKLADLAALVASDVSAEEKQTAIDTLTAEIQAVSEEINSVLEEVASLSVEAPAEPAPTNDAMTPEEESMVADLEAQLQEKDDKIAELEAELEKLKEAEAATTTANDVKRVFGDSVAITSKMSSVEMKRATVVSTGAYTASTVKTLADCALNSAYAAALTVGAKTNKIGAKLLGDSKPVEKQLPKALRGAK